MLHLRQEMVYSTYFLHWRLVKRFYRVLSNNNMITHFSNSSVQLHTDLPVSIVFLLATLNMQFKITFLSFVMNIYDIKYFHHS